MSRHTARLRRAWAALLVLFVSACATAPVGNADPASRLAALPAQVEGLSRGRVTIYPEVGQGASLGYGGVGTVITVYLYDRGQTDVAAAPQANASAEINTALAEMVQASRAGLYRIVGVAGPYSLPGPDRGLPVTCAPLVVTLRDGQPRQSVACVGFSRQHYLKLRATGQGDLQPLLARFVTGLCPHL